MAKLHMYLVSKSIKQTCSSCNELVLPKKGVSVFNLILYVILAGLVYLFAKSSLAIFLPFALIAVEYIFFARPRCPLCKEES